MTQGVLDKFSDASWRSTNISMPVLPPELLASTRVWAYLGGSLAQSQNMIVGSPPIVEVGTPAYPPTGNFVSIGPTTSPTHGAGYFDTGVRDDSRSFTLVSVCRAQGISGSMNLISANDPIGVGSGFGILWQIQTSGAPCCNCSINGPSINLKLPAKSLGDQQFFHIYIVTYDDPTYTMTIWDFTAGTSISMVGGSFTRALSSTGTFWIGQNQRFTTGVVSAADQAFAGKISVSINATQAGQIAAHLRASYALMGMMV